MAPASPMAHVGAYGNIPPGGVLIGPFSQATFLARFWWFPASLVLVAAGLIFFNGVALLSTDFFTTWIAILPWIASLGYFGFILGVVLGIVLIGAFVLMLLGFRVIAAFIILPTAIVSLFIGGGFFAGLILGVLAGLLELLRIKFP